MSFSSPLIPTNSHVIASSDSSEFDSPFLVHVGYTLISTHGHSPLEITFINEIIIMFFHQIRSPRGSFVWALGPIA